MASKRNSIMLDLETLNTTPDAAVLSIGAVDINNLNNSFHGIIDMNDAVRYGTVGASTVKFWMQEALSGSPAAKEIVNEGHDAWEVVQNFIIWVQTVQYSNPHNLPPFRIWCKYAAFDFPIITNLVDRMGCTLPWAYYEQYCATTIFKLTPDVFDDEPNQHSAVGDAINQARRLIKIQNAYPELDIL